MSYGRLMVNYKVRGAKEEERSGGALRGVVYYKVRGASSGIWDKPRKIGGMLVR